jgi:hypothetical protein
MYQHKGEMMIHLHTMTKEEFDEYFRHNVLNDTAELVLKYGYDDVMSDLASIVNNKLDNLEPVK